ncbi:Metacaspase-3 [Psilocybe cubensis]|uniref:Peptidase C14 caspase domain-containing protein n=2 Tax=Psilocybe cubensis TaxID=181762 RepID=A0A8H8CQC7_PSICU|nr:Metacaspase-3 [Psilocybe cubensis]KAH9485564.1 Metacaspase-3 [Psilocybe cubensis]
MTASRIFALLIGIDSYKSGNVWNLHSCVEDAKKMKRWLANELNVPKDHICLLLDHHATKNKIEDSFMAHLVNNPSIEPGDSIFLYFAGHGSCMPAPVGWFLGQEEKKKGTVEVLCPYDHDTKSHHGRVSGISDRSLYAMLDDLASVKGDNITLFFDCCFSPNQNSVNDRDRSITRWTKTTKATSEDLYRDLWVGARGKLQNSSYGFFNPLSVHTLLAACPPGHKAVEGKDGGRFTSCFLEAASHMPLYRTTYTALIDYLLEIDGESQRFVCFGSQKGKVLFNQVPFTPDSLFTPTTFDKVSKLLKVNLGTIHGVVEGSEISLHLHNYRCSFNPPIALSVVSEVNPTSCVARIKLQNIDIPELCWAKVIQWNNRRPFCVYFKSTLLSLLRIFKLKKSFPKEQDSVTPFKSGVSISRVTNPNTADLLLSLRQRCSVLAQKNAVYPEKDRHFVEIEDKSPLAVIDDAARFNLHLLRHNVDNPLRDLVEMEISRLDPISWSKVGHSYLLNGRATLIHQNGAVYDIALHNKSKIDIWPYLFYMDPNCYRSTLIYKPDSYQCAPLPRDGSLSIGAGRFGAEALSSAGKNNVNLAYLKLFLSSVPVEMELLEQDPLPYWIDQKTQVARNILTDSGREIIWDTALASLTFLRHPDGNS